MGKQGFLRIARSLQFYHRILAEAALIEVDKYLLSIEANFCRFVDDYRFFAPDINSAHYWLTQLIERLWLEGLTINKSKTQIEDVESIIATDKVNTDNAQGTTQHAKPASKKSRKESIVEPQFRIVAGYGGVIPTLFRLPSQKELDKLKKSNLKKKLADFKSKSIPSPADITDIIKTIIGTGSFDKFAELPNISELFPQFTPYIVDVLAKYGANIKDKIRRDISCYFAKKIASIEYLPEYIAISLVRLLGTQGYEKKDTLFDYFRNLKRNSGAYIGRVLLDSLESQLARGEILEIRQYFTRADSWEKRQIVRIVNKYLPEDEKRPWLKNVKTQEEKELFLVEYIKPTKTGKDKRKQAHK